MLKLTILLATFAAVQCISKIDILPKNSPIIFTKLANAHVSYENYAMIYYVDLDEYFHLRETINHTITLAEGTCNQLENDMCTTTTQQLRSQLNMAIRDDENIGAMRQRRGLCNWCGKLQNFMYGTLDHDKAEEIVNALNENGNETVILHELMKNQTSLFRASLKVNQQDMSNVQHALSYFTVHLNETQYTFKMAESINGARYKTVTLNQIASMALNEHFRMYTQLSRTLADARNHRIPEMISQNTLTRDLKSIVAKLKPSQRLPIDLTRENPMHIFKYSEVTSFLIKNKLLIEIMIPIAETERYALYRATPVPVQTRFGRVILQSPSSHFLLNVDKTKFINLPQNDLDNGKMLSPTESLYRPSTSTDLKYDSNCVWRILVENAIDASLKVCDFHAFVQNDVIITIIENERYFFASRNGTTFWEICDDGEHQRSIIGENIITLDPECYIKTATVIIKPHRTHVFNQTQTISLKLSTSNISITHLTDLTQKSFANLNLTDLTPIVVHDPQQMQQIIDKTDEMVKKANHEFKLKQVSLETGGLFDKFSFDMKSFSWITSSLTAAAVLILVIIAGIFIIQKFNVFSTIIKALGFSPKLSKEGGVIVNLTEAPISTLRPNTPYPKTKIIQHSASAPAPEYTESWNEINELN